MELKIQKEIVEKYGLIDGQKITGKQLKQMAAEKNLKIEEVITLLGISESAKYRIQKSDKTKMRVNLKVETERENTIEKIKEIVSNKKHLKLEDLIELEEQTQMAYSLFLSNIGIKSNQYYKMKYSSKYVWKNRNEYVPTERDLQIIKRIKYKDTISKREIEKLKREFDITNKQMILILNVRTANYRNVMNERTKRLKIDLLSRAEKTKILEKIKNYKSEGTVTIDDINYIKRKVKTTDLLIKQAFGLKTNLYRNLLNYKIHNSRIVDLEEQRKVKLLKIELKHNKKYGERYYQKKELMKIAREQGINWQAIILYLYHPSYYFFNSLALEKNEEGFWIGENRELTNEFWVENKDLLEKLSLEAALNVISWFKSDKGRIQEFKKIAYDTITMSSLLIEKNFKFNKKLQNALLRRKGKYGILKVIRKERKFYHYQQHELECGDLEERSNIFADNTYNPNQIIDNQTNFNLYDIIKDKEQRKLCFFMQRYENVMKKERKKWLKFVQKHMKLSLEQIEQMIEKIGYLMIKSKKIKKTKNGMYITTYD